jgi:hypothetical protein
LVEKLEGKRKPKDLIMYDDNIKKGLAKGG